MRNGFILVFNLINSSLKMKSLHREGGSKIPTAPPLFPERERHGKRPLQYSALCGIEKNVSSMEMQGRKISASFWKLLVQVFISHLYYGNKPLAMCLSSFFSFTFFTTWTIFLLEDQINYATNVYQTFSIWLRKSPTLPGPQFPLL